MNKTEKLKEIKEFENYLSSKGRSEVYSVYLNDTPFEVKFEILADFIIEYFKQKPYHTFNQTGGFSASKTQDEMEVSQYKIESHKLSTEGSENIKKKLDCILKKFHVIDNINYKEIKKSKQNDMSLIISNMESILQTCLNISSTNFNLFENENKDIRLKESNNYYKATTDRNSVLNKTNNEIPKLKTNSNHRKVFYSSLPPLKAKAVFGQKNVSVPFENDALRSTKSGNKVKRTAGSSNYFIQSQELLYDPFPNDKLYSAVGKYIEKFSFISNVNYVDNTDLHSYLELSLSDARNTNFIKSMSKQTFLKKKEKSQRTLKGGMSVSKFKSAHQVVRPNTINKKSLVYMQDLEEDNTSLNTISFSGDFQVFFSVKPNDYIRIRGNESRYIAAILLDSVTLQTEIKRLESELSEVNSKLIKAKQFVEYLRSVLKVDADGIKFYESVNQKQPISSIGRNRSAKSLEKHL